VKVKSKVTFGRDDWSCTKLVTQQNLSKSL
jgi:hypothetical protein